MSIETKKKIENCLQSFSQGNLTKNALNLFANIGYNTSWQAALGHPGYSSLKTAFAESKIRFNEEKRL